MLSDATCADVSDPWRRFHFQQWLKNMQVLHQSVFLPKCTTGSERLLCRKRTSVASKGRLRLKEQAMIQLQNDDNLNCLRIVPAGPGLKLSVPPCICLAVHRHASWQCFFPQYSLYHVSHPTFIINSATDFAALLLSFQPPSAEAFIKCIDFVTVNKYQRAPAGCSPAYQAGILTYSTYLRRNVTTLLRTNRGLSSFIMPESKHCVTIYPDWASISAKAHSLPEAVSNWYKS